MAGVAVYSGEIFNNLIGYSSGINAAYKSEQTSFDIFGVHSTDGLQTKHIFLAA